MNLDATFFPLLNELDFMQDWQKWDLNRANIARVNLGMLPLVNRQDMFRAYARGLRRRDDWTGLSQSEVALLIGQAEAITGKFGPVWVKMTEET